MILDFLLNGVEYDKFIKMDGTFSGVDSFGKTTVVTLLDTDIITIIESDYEEVKILYDKKCSDDYDSFLEGERISRKAYEEGQKQEIDYGKPEETETPKRRGFWYRLFHRKSEVSK